MNKTRLVISFLLLDLMSFFCSCGTESDIDYKEEMRIFVSEIASYAREQDPDFMIIPQNGIRLTSTTAEDDGLPVTAYLNVIDALAQESVFYGYDAENEPTPSEETAYYHFFLDLARKEGKEVLVTDYAFTESKMKDSYALNESKGYVSFAADTRELDRIPNFPSPVYNENQQDIEAISKAKNFLYLINPGDFPSKSDYLSAIASTNYDLVIMDAFFRDELLTEADLNQIRVKKNGGKRLLIAYMSIGEAEDYRYYWQNSWRPGSPDWLIAENPNWEGNYKVAYWQNEWKQYIFGSQNSYTQKLLDAGFDGTYLDIIEGFEFFE